MQYIDIGSIDRDSKRVVTTAKVNAATAPTRARQWVRRGDVLVSMTRPNLNAVAMVTPELEGAVASTGFDVLRPIGILPEWLFYRVRTHAFVHDVCEDVQGVVYPAIRPDDVRRHLLPIAPLDEQRRIVEAIESYLSRVDAAVVSFERAQAKLKAYRASVLKVAVEGRLVPTEAELARLEKRDYEPADVLLKRILAERRCRWEATELAKLKVAGKAPKDDKWKAKYQEPATPDTAGLPELPEGWCWTSTEAFYWDAGYGTSKKCSAGAAGPPVLRIPNVVAGRVSLDNLKFALDEANLPSDGGVDPGDFLLVRTNGSRSLIGLGALVSDNYPSAHYFASYLIRLRLVGLEASADWFALAWHGPMMRAQILEVAASSAGQYNVSLTAASEFVVPVPPAAEQRRILAEVARLLSAGDKTAVDMSTNARRCARLRQSILKWAFEGKLVDQDPNDEPADKLLERIRAEHTASNPAKPGRRRRAKAAS